MKSEDPAPKNQRMGHLASLGHNFAKAAKDGTPARAKSVLRSELAEWYYPQGSPSIVEPTDMKREGWATRRFSLFEHK